MNTTTYKMIAIDVDDTLLNDEMQISEGTKLAIAAARDQGVLVTLATGRMFASAQKIAKQLGFNVPIITYQGSLVKNLFDEEVLYERSVPAEAVQFLYDYAERNDLHIQVYHEDKLYVKVDNQKIKEYAAMSNIPYIVAEDFNFFLDKPLTKMLYIDDPAKLDEIAIDLQKQIGSIVHITKSKANFLEFLHPEGTKGHAVKSLAAHYGYDISEVIAIGDSWNDHEMLEVAGLGVAMDNAIDALKQIADFVTLSNNDDGVKHVIDKFILKLS
ncbi:HAD family phosphatase [Paenibacillus psychroresistens]|uniref:HAD family phosphatase n=1 Tax=Paenibacillus psychroresistens TaxID=1778678 RepID=A0A6B8RJV0_9BACL|nr:Cof-type HAD-IIB family hydrolase [Paenibacillus psychroresistens]QGQ96319.1 HAD family phosphatase [Paenibacillus psychroresistens]